MGFSSFLVFVLVVSCFIPGGHLSIVKIETPDDLGVDKKQAEEEFKVHIVEKGTKVMEEIDIDENNDIEYFKVPPHNGLSASDDLFDFKSKITVTRAKEDRVCYVTPLPPGLPGPEALSKGLKKLAKSTPNHDMEKTIQQWVIGDEVDTSTLSKEVQDFCGEFPVYRLEPFTIDSLSVDEIEKRQMHKFTLCTSNVPECNTSKWKYNCQVQQKRCVYYTKCDLNPEIEGVNCASVTEHLYNSIVCCTPTCPY